MLSMISKENIKEEIEKHRYTSLKQPMGEFRIKFQEIPEDHPEPKQAINFTSEDGIEFTKKAESDLLKILGIPYHFYRSLPEEIKRDVFRFKRVQKDLDHIPVIAKTRDNSVEPGKVKVYAFLPEGRAGILNEEVMEKLQNLDVYPLFDQFQLSVTDYKFDLRCMTNEKCKKLSVGDILPGIHIKNSETGNRQCQVLPVIWRLQCTNGLLVPSPNLGDGYSLPAFRDYGRFSKYFPEAVVRSFRFSNQRREKLIKLENVHIESPEELINAFSKEYGLNKETSEGIYRQYITDHGQSAFDLVGAFTAHARNYPDTDRRMKIEAIGYKIMERKWN